MEARASSTSRRRQPGRERSCGRICTACGRRSPPAWGEHADVRRRARRARSPRALLELRRAAARRARARAGLRRRAASASRPRRWSAPDGEVVLSDVAAEMTAIAAARAAALGLRNVQHARARPRGDRRARRRLRRRALPRGPDVRARPGARRARDPPRAAARRPRRDRGLGPARAQPVARASSSTRSARRSARRCRRRASPARSRSTTPTGWPACSPAPGSPTSPSSELPTPLRAGSFDEWWARTSALAGPLAKMLAALPQAARRRSASACGRRCAPYETPDRLEIPGVTLIASARRG